MVSTVDRARRDMNPTIDLTIDETNKDKTPPRRIVTNTDTRQVIAPSAAVPDTRQVIAPSEAVPDTRPVIPPSAAVPNTRPVIPPTAAVPDTRQVIPPSAAGHGGGNAAPLNMWPSLDNYAPGKTSFSHSISGILFLSDGTQ